jgi:hypothetical protein
MKSKILLLPTLLLIVGFSSVTAFSQCDRSKIDAIQCGYFTQGIEDGASDAKNKAVNNYKRYKSKFEDRFESLYRDGYDKGYTSIIPFVRWEKAQREVYDKGYKNGQEDKRRSISKLYQRYEGDYPKVYEPHYKAGYHNGYDGTAKMYDTKLDEIVVASIVKSPDAQAAIPPTPTPTPQIVVATPQPSVNLPTGIVTWKGKVDDRVSISVQGSEVKNVDISGTGMREISHTIKGSLPNRPAQVAVKKIDGRGTVSVIQQPNRSNDFMAIIQVSDPKPEDDKYKIEISWVVDTKEEEYQPGIVFWSGRVDQLSQIKIFGKDVQYIDVSQTGLSSVYFNLTGVLSRRVGKVAVSKAKGRGVVTVIQQPAWENDFVAIVQINDDEKGAFDYQLEISW